MTNENIIEIKKQHKGWFAKGIFFLILTLASLYVSLMPFISKFANKNSKLFFVSGFSLFVIFAFAFVFNIYKTCNPENALILSAHGFIDNINIGNDIEIEWTNVIAVKMLGKASMPYLGITLENTDILITKVKKKAALEIRENINQNLPTILIPQSNVKTPIKELKDTFTKFVREARLLEKNSQQKTKNNPFTTDDVLRAFGKLPTEESDVEINSSNIPSENAGDVSSRNVPNETSQNSPDTENTDITNNDTHEFIRNENISSKISTPFEVPNDISSNPNKENGVKSASDSFYEALRSKASARANEQNTDTSFSSAKNPKDITQSTDISESDMPEEIKEILRRAKSSKISEIEEILSTNDIPYSLSRETDSQDTQNSLDKEGISNTEAFEEAVFADDDKSEESSPDLFEDTSLDFAIKEEQSDCSEEISPRHIGDVLSYGDDERNSNDESFNINLSFVHDNNIESAESISVSSLDTLIKEALNDNTNNVDDSSVNDSDDENLGDTREFIFKQ